MLAPSLNLASKISAMNEEVILGLGSLLLDHSAKDFQILLYDCKVEGLTLLMRAWKTFSGMFFLEQQSLR